MKIAIAYASTHHGNTKRLVDAIAKANQVVLIDVTRTPETNLSSYELIGFASGVAFGKYYPQLLDFVRNNLPEHKKFFAMHTAGRPDPDQAKALLALAGARHGTCLGVYKCKGFDTYGPFKMIGGINKHHPSEEEVEGALAFFQEIIA